MGNLIDISFLDFSFKKAYNWGLPIVAMARGGKRGRPRQSVSIPSPSRMESTHNGVSEDQDPILGSVSPEIGTSQVAAESPLPLEIASSPSC